jgi:hypothetical protein
VARPREVTARRYHLYGLVLECSIPLSCPRAAARSRPDVRLRPGGARRFESARRLLQLPVNPQEWFECRRLSDHTTYLRWAGLFEFLISPDARTIEYRSLEKATDESLTTYLLGQVLSFSLLSRGHEPLHATAVVIDGEAVAFLGDCGYGKSTLGAAFVARGVRILTDDVLALEMRNGRWMAHAGPPRLKLFPSVARRVLAREAGSRLHADTSKLILPLAGAQANDHAVPLRALYVLPDPADRRPRAQARIGVAPVEGQKAFLTLVRSAFNLIQVDRARLANQFDVVTRLLRDVPIRRLTYRRRLSLLDSVCDAVIADVATLRLPPTGIVREAVRSPRRNRTSGPSAWARCIG